MAEKEQKQAYPLAPANGYGRSDEEGASALAKEVRRKQRMKCFAYVVAFAVFQTGVILIFALTVMKVKTPKFRVRSATFETFSVTTSSFDMRMNAELGVKNTNFGHYKYDNSTIAFFYRGEQVGSAFVSKARAKARSTKKLNVTVGLSSTNSALGNDFSSGILPLSSTSRLTGKVELMKVMKKKKATNMNCTMEINIATKQLQNLKCK
ncbi:late embryogenesis abundant protein At1g64065-like [Cornus florida]|uniref:late embryogenesis abundant protein At1g64065-like n=1 Tax=Cornus florida TaxID=4283 RepID=UPI0028A1D58E|nr:late embryogenesis abundant protein At1g64065-like [Cornus florida]